MKGSNQSTGSIRQSESGQVWREVLTGATGSLELYKLTVFRVRAAAGTTVTIGGVLAATMVADEVIIFNAGPGDKADKKATVTVDIANAGAWVQIADDTASGR